MRILIYIVVVIASFLLGFAAKFGHIRLTTDYLVVLLLGLLMLTLVLPATGAMRPGAQFTLLRRIRRLLTGWLIITVGLVGIAAMMKITANYSRVWFGTWALTGAMGLVLGEWLFTTLRRRSPRWISRRRRLVLVGEGAAAQRVDEALAQDSHGDFELLGRFGNHWGDHDTQPLNALEEFVSNEPVDDVWIAASIANSGLLDEALEALRECVIDVHVIPDLEQYRLLNQDMVEWAGLPIINLSGSPTSGMEWRLKTASDYLLAAVLIILTAPLQASIAVLIKLTNGGPVLFRQLRHGLGNETIEVLKFRTMNMHEGAFQQARPGDVRVFSVGRFLRRTSLDELPQLFNVLKGEMSLVGPRPHPVPLDGAFRSTVPKYVLRNKIKPGITGWAQINGLRGITDTEEKMRLRVEHDLWYIQNWSLWLDLRILLQTPLAMLHRNAY